VDFSNGQMGMTVATPENPMVQFGGFHFGDNQAHFALERAMLLGWVTNTYWETNFRAHQPGLVTARYRIRPYAGGFDEGAAHRFGLEAANDAPLMQHMGEPPVAAAAWPASGSLLDLPQPPVVVTHLKPAGEGMLVRLLNASDSVQTARIGSGLVQITGAGRCDLLENPVSDLPVTGGAVELVLQPREMAAVVIRG
jgi:hypothetical protein